MRILDQNKIKKIKKCMKKHSEGTYISEISRETGLSKSTVSYLISNHMQKEVTEVKTGMGNLFKIFKLKKK